MMGTGEWYVAYWPELRDKLHLPRIRAAGYCRAVSRNAMFCNRAADHSGRHAAQGMSRQVLEVWR